MSREIQQRILAYQDHLDRVSRSFAFCIAQLDGELRFFVGHCYLLFRVLDTIEDVSWPDSRSQKKSFHQFNEILEGQWDQADKTCELWLQDLMALDLPEGERRLLEDARSLFFDFHHLLPGTVKDTVKRCALNMSQGMEYFADRSEDQRKLRLKNIFEVNRYCFFVAGVVGELLHQIFSRVHPGVAKSSEDHQRSLLSALHFGLFLQKVNLLKDQRQDEEEGRFLVPSRSEVQQSLIEDGNKALDYLLKLPKDALSYRIFCAWSLFLGIASLPWIEKSWQEKTGIKIPRIRTKLLLDKVAALAHSNEQLSSLFQELLGKVSWPEARVERPPEATQDFPEFKTLYSGEVSSVQLRSLGLI